MFASETILLNPTAACLEYTNYATKWRVRDIIITDRAVYFFAGPKGIDPKDEAKAKEKNAKNNKQPQAPTREETVSNYLTTPYERLDVKNFIAQRIEGRDPRAASFSSELPEMIPGYTQLLGLMNNTNNKQRFLGCTISEVETIQNYFNLVAAYRHYLASTNMELEQNNEHITSFVKNYKTNKGELILEDDIFEANQLKNMIVFGQDNSAIKQLTFSEQIKFENANARKIDALNQVICLISGDQIGCLKFTNNYLTDDILKHLASSFSNQSKLRTLEITGNLLSSQSLETLGNTVFKENRQLKTINLANNLIGDGTNIKDIMTSFLESFLLELVNPESLDMSYNRLSDESLYPIVKYLFANTECRLHMLNIEHNQFTNYAKRTIAQAKLHCSNTNLVAKFGPLPLTSTNVKICLQKPKQEKEHASLSQLESVEMVIRRKPINPEVSFYDMELPISKESQSQIQHYTEKIKKMVQIDYANKVTVEEIREVVMQIVQLPFEFPRHLLEPIFNLVNLKCKAAIAYQDIYCLEILLDTLTLMNARNFLAEKEYQHLSIQAHDVATNLIRAINMEIHDDNEMLKVLVENISIAKKIGMRGEVIDVAVLLKALCSKFLQEMLQNAGTDEEELNQDQVYMLKEDDLQRSVFDAKYSKYADQQEFEQLGITGELEPQLAYHPALADYIKIAALNLNYTKKNLMVSRKHLYDEETYGMINIYTRCAFMLSDGLPDMAKNLTFNNIRNDRDLKIARLLFRYRLNLDNLFPKQVNVRFKFEDFEAEHKDKNFMYAGIQRGLRVEDFPQISSASKAQSLVFQSTMLTKPLTRINPLYQDKTLKFNEVLHKLQNQHTEVSRATYRVIQTLFENYIIKGGKPPSQDFADEIYLQLYKQTNISQSEDREKARLMYLIIALVSRYMDPSANLKPLLSSWLLHKRDDKQLERFVRHTLQNFKMPKTPEPGAKPYVNWPPSIALIEALDKNKQLQVQLLWPSGEETFYPIDDFTTIESILHNRLYKEKFFQREPDPEMYWLFSTDEEGIPLPVSKEKLITQLMYEFEHDFLTREEGIMVGQSRNSEMRRPTFMRIKQVTALEQQRKFVLLIRKRIFTSLHTLSPPNFKNLSNLARQFLYHQLRSDYIDREILMRPNLTSETAVILAALMLKIKFQTKILRSRDNSLTIEIIAKNLDYCLPESFMRDKLHKDQWPAQIQRAFEDQNMKELTLQEAQEQFLILLQSYDFMFGSYFLVKRRIENQIKIKQTNFLTVPRNQKKPRSRSSGSSDEDESDASLTDDDDSDDSNSAHSSSKSKTSSHGKGKQTTEEDKDAAKRLEVFEEHFQNTAESLLLICKQDCILFVDNRKRDKVFLEVLYEDLIYCMGKKDILKIGLLIKKKMSYMTYDQFFDVRTEFTAKNARVIAEDIMAYCQVYLLEQSRAPGEYIEIVKKSAFEMFNQDDNDGFTSKEPKEDLGQAALEHTQKNPGWQIVINDELLKGMTPLKQDTANSLITKGKKSLLKLQREKSFSNDASRDILHPRDSDEETKSVQESDKEHDSFGEEKTDEFTKSKIEREVGEPTITRQMKHQFKIKQQNFLVYCKSHPCYVSSQQDLDESLTKFDKNQQSKQDASKARQPMNKEQEVAFNLANHTIAQIDEESEHESEADEIDPIKRNLLGMKEDNYSSKSNKSGTQTPNRTGILKSPKTKTAMPTITVSPDTSNYNSRNSNSQFNSQRSEAQLNNLPQQIQQKTTTGAERKVSILEEPQIVKPIETKSQANSVLTDVTRVEETKSQPTKVDPIKPAPAKADITVNTSTDSAKPTPAKAAIAKPDAKPKAAETKPAEQVKQPETKPSDGNTDFKAFLDLMNSSKKQPAAAYNSNSTDKKTIQSSSSTASIVNNSILNNSLSGPALQPQKQAAEPRPSLSKPDFLNVSPEQKQKNLGTVFKGLKPPPPSKKK